MQLTPLLGSDRVPTAVRDVIPGLLSRLDALKADSAAVRGAARDAMLAELEVLDRRLLDAALDGLDVDVRDTLTAEARRDLAPFRDRLTADQLASSQQSAFERLVRAMRGLPVVRFE